MARKTFISYKYSDVVENKSDNLREKIIKRLGDDAKFYRGENGYTKDLSSYTASFIKKTLKDMMYDTSVTIVILSPNMKLSQWIEWEIEYSLREVTRNDRTSHPNGIVAVVQKQPLYFNSDGYAWLKRWDGKWDETRLFSVLRGNRDNKKIYAPVTLSNHYVDIVTEDDFLRDPSRYIEEAFHKSQCTDCYYLVKQGDTW